MAERTGLLSRFRRTPEDQEDVRETHTFSPEAARLLKKRGYRIFLLGENSTEELQTRGWGSTIERRMRRFITGQLPCKVEVAIRPGEIIKDSIFGEFQQYWQLKAIEERDQALSVTALGAKMIMGDATLYFHLDKEYEEQEGKPLFRRQFVRTTTDTTRKLPEMLDMLFGIKDMAIVGRRKRSGPLEVKNYPQSPSCFYQPGYDYAADFILDLGGRNYPEYPVNIYTVPLVVPQTYFETLPFNPQTCTPSEQLGFSKSSPAAN